MHYHKNTNRLTVELQGNFNLDVVRKIENLPLEQKDLYIDLEQSRFVDTEAIIFLHKLIQNQQVIRLKNPPKLFFEALRILGLHKVWDLKNIVER
ncbi:STAS domain-containing protein [Aliifodinibius sp. S!AR15-10]|uniref:hypothetical protein n=1 Tax=Aliifodinibius sp. S!AR15-10 TaxID=2950437 RepID=UPI0028569DF4|nr:hypothetical protein [Aliifodinibius sp. S!AR15-10]MDR8389648.1 STAS domain-containing protein [Aliifodinibius sp. S!AR15-10]